ncbi:MAG: lysozyme, partial [Thermoplasmata archaeon]|nr:lysozyme [Thermoplasmata archaeon]NIY03004.1 lysozyme [Thermoplasmata archaeon]
MARKSTEWLVVHASATPPQWDIGVAEIRDMHVKRGWRDIGYHYVIRRNGKVEKGRPEAEIGAHVRGWNSKSIGICLVGGIDAEGTPIANYTRKQYEALEGLLRSLMQKYQRTNPVQVCGHRDFPG